MSASREQLLAWIERGEPFAIATVTAVEGSAPRAPGSTLLVSASGERFVGSVSAGCLDNDVVAAATEVLKSKQHRVLHFGPDGVPPWQDGLSCGGNVEVRVDPWFAFMPAFEMKELAEHVRSWLNTNTHAAILSRGDEHFGFDLAGKFAGRRKAFTDAEIQRARALLESEGRSTLEKSTEPFFIRTMVRPPLLVLVGAVDTAAHLVGLAQNSGFSCVVIDPRKHYASAERFPVAPRQLINAWPHDLSAFGLSRRDAALVLTHDPKIDDPALLALLKTQVGYIGALGSQRSHAARVERLKSHGVTDSELKRIEGPAGLRLGASSAAGIALGMLAGVVRALAKVNAQS
ncbi:MAG: XdhC family protein [Nibricoccus sp.]